MIDYIADKISSMMAQANRTPPPALSEATISSLVTGQIDKSLLSISEPKRLRNKVHLKFVASNASDLWERTVRSAPSALCPARAIGLKVSDEFTVSLCRGHLRQLHQVGDEKAWWAERKINPLDVAKALWAETQSNSEKLNTRQVGEGRAKRDRSDEKSEILRQMPQD